VAGLATALFLGIVVGSIYSLSAFGLVLTYRTSGVFNFAHGATGMISAYAFYQLVQGGPVNLVVLTYEQTWRLPTPVAFVGVVAVIAPFFGWLFHRVLFRHLRSAGEVVKIVVTIGLLVALQGLAGVMWGAATTLTPTSIFSTHVFTAGTFRATGEQIAAVVLTGALCVLLLGFLRYTKLGVRMRAVVDRAEMAELAGVDSERVSAASWAIGVGFAAISGILIVPFFGSLDPTTLTFVVVAAAAAAIAGRLASFPYVLAGGYGIGMAQMLVQRYAGSNVARQLRPSIPFLVLFGLLFLPQWRRKPSDRFTPPPLPGIVRPSARVTAIAVAVAAAAIFVMPFVLSPAWQLQIARVPAVALIFLSLVVVTGYGGEVSLCQAALAGFGAFVTAHLVAGFHVPFFAAVLVGGLAVVPIGVFLAVRAANLSPLFLGLATVAFGAVMDEVAFTSRRFSGGLAGIFFNRPGYLASPRVYYFVTAGIFAVVAVGVENLRRSRTGLELAAMRDTELGTGSIGIDVARLKITAFTLSAMIAGVGGALFSAADRLATPFTYFKLNSLLFLALAVIGGIGTWSGALLGATIFQLAPSVVHLPAVGSNPVTRLVFRDQLEALLPVVFGLGAIGLARNPQGLVEQIRSWFVAGERSREPIGVLTRAEPVTIEAIGGRPVMFVDGGMYHDPNCLLAVGKDNGHDVGADEAARLRPCPVCEPRL
jgi:branched-subunit amino acid ABC-type transport system permease component